MQLTVYKASAGSGKTYTLTREYLKQALRAANNPYIFRSILAVTFTNKATEEMKNRIVTTLNSLAQGNNDVLSQELQHELNIDIVELQQRAHKVRSAILHNYTHFSVSTIDTFFQKILHAFVREAGLRPGFNLELDINRLLEEAVDKLMQSASTNEVLRKWLFALIENRIEDRSSWDMRPMLLSLGSEVFNEQFRRFGNNFHTKTSDKAFMESYASILNEVVSIFDKKMRMLGSTALNTIKKAGLEISDFKFGTSGFANFFVKISKGDFDSPKQRVYDAIESIDGWVSKNSKKRTEVEAIYPTLLTMLTTAVEYWQNNYTAYSTAAEIARKFRELGVLADIDKNIKDIAGDENIMPISDSVHLLSTLINDSDTPFVYERTGNRYKTFMIDEFQDTSIIQWTNFRPLLHNSLAENQFSMVVGDVKQSIYRWRNGDWRILAYQLARDFQAFGINAQNLDTNWRSKAVIVEFNNTLFSRFAAYLQALLATSINENSTNLLPADKAVLEAIVNTAYTDAAQKTSPKTNSNEGYVSIDIVNFDDEQNAIEKVIANLPQLIIDLQDRGYQPNDIAILVRRRNEGQQIADSLLAYKKSSGDTAHCFDVISHDSLFIANASCVQIVIAALQAAINPNDAINIAFLKHQLVLRQYQTISLHQTFTEGLTDDELQFLQHLSNQPLNQAFELLVQHYNLNTIADELPFLQELHDLITTFSNRKLSDISLFLQWWDDKGHTSTLSPGENQRAITILTIHKSKGLQFPVVIMPFTNWSVEPNRDTTIWVSPQHAPFNELPYVPVVYSKALQSTHFNTEYLTEKAQSYIDNINLLYVAFTRAESELYITIPQGKKIDSRALSTLLPEFLRQYIGVSAEFDFGTLHGKNKNEGKYIEFGTKQDYKTKASNNQNFVLSEYPSNLFERKLRLRYESDDYFNAQPSSPLQRRNYGILLHRVFAEIKTATDCSTVIDSLYAEGLIDNEGKTVITQKIEKALAHPIASQWFDGSWQVKTETGLVLPADRNTSLIQRPDRVMIRPNETVVIDYKFGLIEDKQYSKQLARYTQLLIQMGYPNVNAYIWYVDLEKVVAINAR